jgi:hypothetical protein
VHLDGKTKGVVMAPRLVEDAIVILGIRDEEAVLDDMLLDF